MSGENIKILSSTWYHYPNCVVAFEPNLVAGAGVHALIGIVTVIDESGNIKRYIGTGCGQNQNEDELRIALLSEGLLKNGMPFT